MIIIGLTGGIGSGKSTVAQLFAEHGTPVLDADVIARQLTEIHQPAWEKIQAYFGPEVLQADQSLNRAKLRELVFNDPDKRRWLEQLLHPMITEEIKKELPKLDAPYCIVTIPLLVETGPYSFINRILVVDADEETQLQRLKVRDKSQAEDLKKIIASQISREKRLAAAQDHIQNHGKLEELQVKVDELHQLYLSLNHNCSGCGRHGD